tara:strand:+ start:10954 stop:11337 length:384 start_codon:yes stop_codon:yes gene_type:complete
MSFSNFLELEVLDHVFRNSAYTAPSTIYVALFTSAPNDAGGGTEVSGNGYARQSMAFGTASSGSISNSSSVEFPTATGDQGTIVAMGLFDASSSGNLLAYGSLTSNKTVSNGDVFRFNASSVTISLD